MYSITNVVAGARTNDPAYLRVGQKRKKEKESGGNSKLNIIANRRRDFPKVLRVLNE